MSPGTTKICDPETCRCRGDLCTLKSVTKEQWDKMNKLDERQDKILNRINISLATLCVACVLLAVNLVLKTIGG